MPQASVLLLTEITVSSSHFYHDTSLLVSTLFSTHMQSINQSINPFIS